MVWIPWRKWIEPLYGLRQPLIQTGEAEWAALVDLTGQIHHLVKTPIEPYFSERPGWAEVMTCI